MTMQNLVFARLTKVDESRQEVWGRVADEAPDRKNEILDYESSKPHFLAWSEEFRKATEGKSLGNLRVMHQRLAAGIVTDLWFDDVAKTIDVVAQVIDPGEWQKVLAGVYTGLSVGGDYGRKWREGKYMRYTAIPNEISLVDNPAIPSARFTLVKMDGSEEERQFAEPEVGEAAPAARESLQKGLYEVGRLAGVLEDLNRIRQDLEFEARQEEDGSPTPAKLQELLAGLVEILKEVVAEETAELLAGAEQRLPVAEAGISLSKAIYDYTAALEATGPGGESMGADKNASDVLAKLAETEGSLAKLMADNQTLVEKLEKLAEANADLTARLEKLEAQPAPAQAALKAVDKGEDVDAAPLAKSNDPLTVMKTAQSQPISVIGR
ncbi:MAG: hypothetical protein ABT940_13075 [Alphaproteobacteria bacterium]